MRRPLWLLLFLTLVIGKLAHAQSCNPAVINYVVRDEKGVVLNAADLKSVADGLPKQIGDATTSISETSFGPDSQTFYWPESVEWKTGTKVPTLEFANAGICALHFSEATLTYHKKKMRLVFDIEILRFQNDRRPVINSLPFQAGTFKLDLVGWNHAENKMIPATHWKRVR